MAKQYNIIRVNSSSYYASNFITKEKKALTSTKTIYTSKYGNHNILITNTTSNITNLTNVDLIIHPNSGFDNLSYKVARSKIPIILGNPIRATAVCNYILSALFQQLSPIKNYPDLKNRKFNRNLLSSKKILLIGFGHIGKLVYDALKHLADISIYDPYKNYFLGNHLKNFHVVILACGLNADNFEFIDKRFLDNQSPELLLINAARSELIKEDDLIKFLKTNSKAYAYLDVFGKDSNDSTKFKHITNVNLTPHIAGVCLEISNRTIDFEKKVIDSFLNDKNFLKKYSSLLLNNYPKSLFLKI